MTDDEIAIFATGDLRNPSPAMLRMWANIQKMGYHAGELPPDKIQQLEGLPGWTWGMTRKEFEEFKENLARIAKYQENAESQKRRQIRRELRNKGS